MKCDKCSIEIFGGFDPTGFAFPPCQDCFDNKTHLLCMGCYAKFWKEFGILRDNFVDEFFRKEEMGRGLNEVRKNNCLK